MPRTPGTYFIADLHLAAERPGVTRAFDRWLRDREGCHALYILGDLFETWVGDDDDAPLAEEVRSLLRRFRQSGAGLYLMHGNRDFLIAEAFCEDVGAELLEDPSTIEMHGERVLLMHGDSLCTRDVEYQAFRALTRAADWREQILSRSLPQRRALARDLRQASDKAAGGKAREILDVTEDAVQAALASHGARRLIHGHTHRPGWHRHPSGERWVLGDWSSRGWHLEATSSDFELVSFAIDQ